MSLSTAARRPARRSASLASLEGDFFAGFFAGFSGFFAGFFAGFVSLAVGALVTRSSALFTSDRSALFFAIFFALTPHAPSRSTPHLDR